MLVLRDNELELKTISDGDADPLFRLIDKNRDHIRKWLSWIDNVKTLDDEKKEIVEWIEKEKNGESLIFGIWFKKILVGIISLEYISSINRNAELGYWLDEEHQGKGIITKSCKMVIDHAFKSLKLHRVEIFCATKNDRSCSVAKRLGFKEEGIARESGLINGKFLDHYLFSMLVHEWKNS